MLLKGVKGGLERAMKIMMPALFVLLVLLVAISCSFCDFTDFPDSIERHVGDIGLTTAVVIAEPTLGKLYVTRGAASRNWPETYSL